VADDPDNLAVAVEATIARLEALGQAETQLDRRRQALRAMHYEQGIPRTEVFRLLHNALRDRGLTDEQMRAAGVGFDSIVKVLRREGPRP
jgi:hypothetical protein